MLDGDDAVELAPHEAATRAGIAFQRPGTQLTGVSATVYEEVAFGPSNLGLPLDEIVSRTESALEGLGIGELAARDPERLSGGQRQLVALAAILAMGPRHLILDEPTAELDPHGTSLVGDAVERLAARGIGILIAEHRTDLLLRVCSRVLVLADGSVVADGTAETVLRDERLPQLGVNEPSAVRVERLLEAAGVNPPT